MSFNFFSDKYFKYSVLTIYVAFFLFAFSRPIETFPDSQGYLNMSIYRSPVYPIFLSIVKLISGAFFNSITLVVQIGFSLFAIHYFVKKLKEHISIHPIWFLLLTIILLIPCFYSQSITNRFLSEALAFPLYLLVLSHFCISFIQENRKYLMYGLLFLFVLMLTRGQFIFLVPIALLILLYISLKKKELKKNSWLFLFVLLFPFLVSLCDKTYHSIKHDAFVSTPWSGIHLLSSAMYVSDKEDVSLFSSEKERIFFSTIYDLLAEKNLNIHHLNLSAYDDESSFYITNFTNIANSTIFNVGKNLVGQDLTYEETFIALDKLTLNMTMPLVLDNLGPWLKLYLKNVIHGFGGSKYFLLYIILLVFGLLNIKESDDPRIKLITLGALLTLTNVSVVAIGIATAKRYMFYNDWILFFIAFILLDILMKKKTYILS